ncbi:MAG: ATP-dependent helicase/nuclease subunit B [Planctomycetota bacterium]|jgi:ATP-dependent helicase/nuclease subunit B
MVEAVGIERVFLDWTGMPLEAATDWLIANYPDGMQDLRVALPGARSGRLLLDALARKAGSSFRPPVVTTAGTLSDDLLRLDGTIASRLARTLAWANALRSINPEDLTRIVARPPQAKDQGSWFRLAEEVRGLFAELAAEGLDFETVVDSKKLPELDGERKRWSALAAAQAKMQEALNKAGTIDPHLGRMRAINEANLTAGGDVVLVGVVEMNGLLRQALEASESTITALIFAPEALTESFDELGCLRSEAWVLRDVNLPLDSWRVVDRPSDQGDAVVEELASWNGEFSANEITIGLANTDVGPFVKRRLTSHDVLARDAAGSPLGATGPLKLLSAIGRYLQTKRFSDYANLVRHPDFESALRKRNGKLEPVGTVDTYHNGHLPDLADGTWLRNPGAKYGARLQKEMHELWGTSQELLEPLVNSKRGKMHKVTETLRTLLEHIYGTEPLNPTIERDRCRLFSLQQIASAFSEIEELPSQLAPEGDIHETLDLVQRLLKSEIVPPRATRADETSIEMLGWLELPLDTAPALVVVGFEDGHVPESVRGDAFLPNSLRRGLGLVDDDKRLARDLYVTELLLQSRQRIAFVTGRRSLEGDPQVPSRIVFHCPADDVVPRVRRFLDGTSSFIPQVKNKRQATVLPQREHEFELTHISVTDFRAYLRSPYQYYLERVLQLKTLDDRAREMDPLAFGNLAHDVLQRFGQDKKIRDAIEPKKIATYLCGTLHDLAGEIYGAKPLPAVRFQLEQLDYRLRIFADRQAQRRAKGWMILASEWQPDGGSVPLIVDGKTIELRGRIDRIDHDPIGKRFAIWDYKTGDARSSPGNAHRKSDGTWRDLQLPLYCILAAELIGEDPPEELGYGSLCKTTHEIGFDHVKTWGGSGDDKVEFDEGIGLGYEAALDVVRAIRRGEFLIPEGFDPRDEILRAIGGLDLVDAMDEEEGE